MINYPANLDSFTNPGPTDTEDQAGVEHDIQHSNLNDAVEALQAKVGIDNSAVATSVDYFMKHFFTKGTINPSADPGLSTAFYLNTATKTLWMWDGSTWN